MAGIHRVQRAMLELVSNTRDEVARRDVPRLHHGTETADKE